jgi:dTDP-glucose pyrophosphorylase
MADRFAIILAAGKGTRMKSPRPKVLHEIGGRSMLAWSVALAKDLGCKRSVVVVGPDMPVLSEAAAKLVGAENVVIQRDQLGTANAVDAARDALKDADGHAIVLYADTPLVPKEAGERAFAEIEKGASICVLGFIATLPNRYGRLVTDGNGSLEAIVEANDADESQLQIELANSGVMAAPVKLMFDLLGQVTNHNAKGEYYLTDLVGLARERSLVVLEDTCESLGSRAALAGGGGGPGAMLGTFGAFGAFSFYFSHHITSGEGGMVVCQTEADYNCLRRHRAHGWTRHLTNRAAVEAQHADVGREGHVVELGDLRLVERDGRLERLVR